MRERPNSSESRDTGPDCSAEHIHAFREVLTWRTIVVVLVTSGSIVIILAVTGLTGTDPQTLGRRLAYCGLCAGFGGPICYANNAVTRYFVRSRSPICLALALTGTTAIAAVPCAAVGFVIYGQLSSSEPEFLDVYLQAANVMLLASFFLQFVVGHRLGHLATAARTAAGPNGNRVAEGPGGRDAAAGPSRLAAAHRDRRKRFFDRLAQTVGGELIYVQTRNHYLKIFTTTGNVQMRMRFSDAVGALGELGMQVHRSYWVAHNHVIGPVTRERRMLLRVTGDDEVPISRPYVETVRAALRIRSGYQDSGAQLPGT